MHVPEGDEGSITGINVTPLVDIILVVLIIFMATAPMIQQRSMKVDLPKAAQHERAATEALTVVFDAKRELSLAGKTVTREQLQQSLTRAVALRADVHVLLSADKVVPYGEVVAVLDGIRAAGVRKVGLQVVTR